MKESIFRNLCRRRHKPATVYKALPGTTLIGLGNSPVPFLGWTKVYVYGRALEFFIIPDDSGFRHEILMGDNGLRRLDATLSYGKGEGDWLKLAGRKFSFAKSSMTDEVHELAELTLLSDKYAAEYPEVFQKDDADMLPATGAMKMTIDTQGARPIWSRPYRLPLSKKKFVEQEIDKLLRLRIIEPSCSPWAAPLVIVPKTMVCPETGEVLHNADFRMCCDYRRLNEVTLNDAGPLPSIQEIYDGLQGSKIFSKLDLKSGYYQVEMDEESKEKTAFVCHRGQYQFRRMPFGLRCAPPRFQRMMNVLFHDLIGVSIFIYLDDIIIFSTSPEEHEKHLRQVFERLKEHRLTLKPSKCEFFLPEVKMLGFIISGDGLRADPEKIAAITKLPPPTSVTEVRSFLGAVNYHRKLINNYAQLEKPLRELTRKHQRWKWTQVEQHAFDRLKEALISSDVMAHPDPNKKYKLYTDASAYALGGILVQTDDDGIDRPIQYVSKAFDKRQQHWPAIQREGFALVYCIKKLQPYLHGAEFHCYTDHKPLKVLFTNENKNTSIQKWSIYLSEMGAKISYHEGRKNTRADWLSRLKYHNTLATPSDLNVVTADDQLYQELVEIAALEDELIQEENLITDLADIYKDSDKHLIPWNYFGLDKLAIMEEQKTLPQYKYGLEEVDDYIVIDGLLYTLRPPSQCRDIYPRLVLPPSAQKAVIRKCHTEVGHMSVNKTLSRLHELYSWPMMRAQTYQVIKNCARCQVHSERRERPHPTWMPVARYPNQIISIDFVGPFAASPEGNKYLITCIDHLTGWIVTKPVPTKETHHMLKFFELDYNPTYGIPEIVIADNAFRCETTLKPYLEALLVDLRFISPHHPQSNAKVERCHRTLKQMIRKICNAKFSDWENALGPSLLAYRTAVSSTTKYSPFYLTFGRHAFTNRPHFLTRDLGTGPEAIAHRVDELSLAFREAARNIEESRQYNHARLEKQANAEPIALGDHVVVAIHDRNSLDPKWSHGFLVTRVRGSVITAVGPKNKLWRGNRKDVKKVSSEADWEELNERISPYLQRKARNLVPLQRAEGQGNLDVPAHRAHAGAPVIPDLVENQPGIPDQPVGDQDPVPGGPIQQDGQLPAVVSPVGAAALPADDMDVEVEDANDPDYKAPKVVTTTRDDIMTRARQLRAIQDANTPNTSHLRSSVIRKRQDLSPDEEAVEPPMKRYNLRSQPTPDVQRVLQMDVLECVRNMEIFDEQNDCNV